MTDDWQSLQDLFHQASELGDTAQAAFLAELSEELQCLLEPLLAHDKKGFALSLDAIAEFFETRP
ncbi:MAG: hypothetical protein AAGI44_09175 [Pseudomonadota bacterium]